MEFKKFKGDMKECIDTLFRSFPNGFVNDNGEFIAHQKTNQYFILTDCETALDVECKVIEWLSRSACKTSPYKSEWKNKTFHAFMLNCINDFLGTSFDYEDITLIYTYLGNTCNHEKTIQFIKNDFNLDILKSIH